MVQKLDIYQSLWAMELRRPDGFEWRQDERFEMVAEAGYAGMCLDFGEDEIEAHRLLKPHFNATGLKCLINAFPTSIEGFKPILELAKEVDAPQVNIIGWMFPLTVEEGIPIAEGWIKLGEEFDIPVLFETHRNCLTNDLHYTLQLMEAVSKMRLCADLSHYVVDREFELPIPDVDQAKILKVLERSDCFQGRIATREQIQVPIEFAQHQKWVEIFKDWWKVGMDLWRKRAGQDETLIFLCELGPPDYAITGADGYELSDRWQEALIIKKWAEEIWTALET